MKYRRVVAGAGAVALGIALAVAGVPRRQQHRTSLYAGNSWMAGRRRLWKLAGSRFVQNVLGFTCLLDQLENWVELRRGEARKHYGRRRT